MASSTCELELSEPLALSAPSQDHVIIADRGAAGAFKLTWETCSLAALTSRGGGPGELQRYSSAASSGDRLVAYDNVSKQAVLVGTDGAGLLAMDLSANALGARLSAILPRGDLLFEERPLVMTPDGPSLADSAVISAVNLDGRRDTLGVVRRAPVVTTVASTVGTDGQVRTQSLAYTQPFMPEDAWGVGPKDRVCVFEGEALRLRCAGEGGTSGPTVSLASYTVTEAHKAGVRLPDQVRAGYDWPTRLPPTMGGQLVPSFDGQLYVALTTEPTKDEVRYLVLGSDGVPKHILILQGDARLLLVTPSTLYWVTTSADGELLLSKAVSR